MLRIAAGLKVGAEHLAEKRRLRQRGAELERGNPAPEAPRFHPADAEARRQSLGVGGAEDHPAVAIEGFHRRLQRRGVLQFGVERVLDDGDAPGLRQRRQTLLGSHRHAGAKRIVHARHGDHGLHAPFGQQQFQRVERHALAGVRGNLDGAQAEVFGQRNQVEIGRRFERDGIARPGNAAQRELQRFHAAVGENDVLRGERHAEVVRVAADLAAQEHGAGRQRVVGEQGGFAPRGVGRQAVELLAGIEVAAFRAGQRQVDGVRVRLRGQHRFDPVEHGGFGRPGWSRLEGQRGRRRRRQARAHEVARLRPRFDLSARFKMAIRGQHGVDAQRAVARGFTYRGQTRSGGEPPVADGAVQFVGQRLIERVVFVRHETGHREGFGMWIQFVLR